MGKYGHGIAQKEKKITIHPAWTGIGCILMILVPLISFAASDLIIENNIDVIAIPQTLRTNVDTGIDGVGNIRYFPAKVIFAIIIAVAVFAILFMIYAAMYKFSGQTGRGPMDAAPSKIKSKKRSR